MNKTAQKLDQDIDISLVLPGQVPTPYLVLVLLPLLLELTNM